MDIVQLNIIGLYCVMLQDDVVVGTLTVRENLMFSANLRLPSSISKKEKEARVDEIIVELGLTRCADSKVRRHMVWGAPQQNL